MSTISSGGSQSGLVVAAGTELDVLSGGVSTSASIAGREVLSGGVDSGGSVQAGGSQVVSAGGAATAALVNAGGNQTVGSGGLASGTQVGGSETVLAGGTSSNTVLQAGLGGFGAATETVTGRAVSTTVSSGGTLIVLGGGTASASTVSAHGMEMVSAGGTALLGTVTASGSLQVLTGGTVTSTLILGGELLMGGIDSAGVVSGTQLVGPGGLAVGETVAAGGGEVVGAGGRVSASVVQGTVALSGGSAAGLTIASGGSLTVSGGSASGTMVAGGGTVVVSSGSTTATVLSAGAASERVLSGGTASGTSVAAGAQQFVAGGLTTGTVVLSGGVQSVGAGGALNDLVSAGGTVTDNAVLGFTEADGSAIRFAGTLSGGGALDQYGPGTLTLAGTLSAFSGAISIYGGTLELASGGAAGAAPISFGSGSLGVLQADADAPGNVISGFVAGDTIDLAGLAFPADGLTVSATGDTVTVLKADGTPATFADGTVARLTVRGASGLLLGAESDGGSGTAIAALASVTAPPNGGTVWQVNALDDGSWVYTEQFGTSVTFSDGGLYSYPSDTNGLAPAPTPLPTGSIIQSGPGTLVLPGYEAYSHFSGSVVIAGGTVATGVPGGGGVTSYSFAAGTTGSLVLTGLEEVPHTTGNGGASYTPAAFRPVTAIAPGDVIDLQFLPFTSGLGTAVGSGSVAITSNGQTVVLASNNPIPISSGVSVMLPITSAGAYTYQLSDDGSGGTDLAVTGYVAGAPVSTSSGAPTSGGAGPPFGNGSVSNGGVTYTVTDYQNGDVGVSETSGTVLSFTSAIASGASLIQSGPGTLALGSTGGVGAADLVISGGTLELGTPSAAASAAVVFAGGTSGVLLVDQPAQGSGGYNNAPANVISGFTDGDAILLSPYLSGSGTLGLAVSGDMVTLTQGGVAVQETNGAGSTASDGSYTLDIAGANNLAFSLAAVPGSNGELALTVACYCAGTLILTERGERPVEALAIGDGVVTASGRTRPIRWIGRRSYSGRLLAGRAELWPVLIRAGALGGGLPRRDLRVSPAHAMLLDGVLVPAGFLVNGGSIVRDRVGERVDYVHVELDDHDAILAEGAASETFVDDDSRQMFQNAAEFAALYPGQRRAPARYCAPRVESGYALEAVRVRLSNVGWVSAA